jgi:hypothetical protein
MDYLETILTRLAKSDICGYQPQAPAATEPTALTALALLAHGREEAARKLVDRLLEMQGEDGSLGVSRVQPEPGWASAWAILAWRAAQKSSIFDKQYVFAWERARHWILLNQGSAADSTGWGGHDTTMRGWAWVVGTHSWVEPTAFNLLALKHTGQGKHPRAREAVAMLINRLIESGGCNYGNTVVFGQTLRPHLEPTGITLTALAGEHDPQGRIERSIAYLQRELNEKTTTASLSYGLLGLAAHGAYPAQAQQWLDAAAQRTLAREPSSYKLALLALAALGDKCPLVTNVWSESPAGEEASAT